MDLGDTTTYQAGAALSSAYRNLNKLFSTLLESHGLTGMQWFVIGTIYDCGKAGIQLTQLSAKLQTGLPFITNTINLLESKGIVERRDSLTDNRSKHVSISPNYEPECRQIEQELKEKLQKSVHADISRNDMKSYAKVLQHISSLKQA